MNKIIITIKWCNDCMFRDQSDMDLWCGYKQTSLYLGKVDWCEPIEIPDECPLLLLKQD